VKDNPLNGDEVHKETLIGIYIRVYYYTSKKDYIMERIHSKEDLGLILSYMRAINMIDSHCYRSVRNTNIIDLARFIYNLGMISDIVKYKQKD